MEYGFIYIHPAVILHPFLYKSVFFTKYFAFCYILIVYKQYSFTPIRIYFLHFTIRSCLVLKSMYYLSEFKSISLMCEILSFQVSNTQWHSIVWPFRTKLWLLYKGIRIGSSFCPTPIPTSAIRNYLDYSCSQKDTQKKSLQCWQNWWSMWFKNNSSISKLIHFQ